MENKSLVNKKTEDKNKSKPSGDDEKDKKSPSKDESSLATAPDNQENFNGNG